LLGIDAGGPSDGDREGGGVDPVSPGSEDPDLRTLEAAPVEEMLGVLELVAFDLVAEQAALGERAAVDRFDRRDVVLADFCDVELRYGPNDGDPPVQPGDERRRLDADLAVTSDDLTGRHLVPEHSPGQDADLIV